MMALSLLHVTPACFFIYDQRFQGTAALASTVRREGVGVRVSALPTDDRHSAKRVQPLSVTAGVTGKAQMGQLSV